MFAPSSRTRRKRASSDPPVLRLNTGADMPQIGFGTWGIKPAEVASAVKAAIAAGYRTLDLAPVYRNQEEVGSALASAFAEGRISRHELFLTSKVAPTSACDEHALRKDVEQSLRDLQTTYLDLLLLHWPFCFRPGATATAWPPPLEYRLGYNASQLRATWRTMEALHSSGVVRAIGVSNVGLHRLQRLLSSPDLAVVPAVLQTELPPYLPMASLRAFCRQHGIIVTAYSSLGNVGRPSKYHHSGDPVLLDEAVVRATARATASSPAAVVLAWARQRGVAVIPKSTHPERIHANFASRLVVLSERQLSAIDRLDRNHRFLAANWRQYAWKPEQTLDEILDDLEAPHGALPPLPSRPKGLPLGMLAMLLPLAAALLVLLKRAGARVGISAVASPRRL